MSVGNGWPWSAKAGLGKGCCEKERNSGRTFPMRPLYAGEGHRRGPLELFGSSKYLSECDQGNT